MFDIISNLVRPTCEFNEFSDHARLHIELLHNFVEDETNTPSVVNLDTCKPRKRVDGNQSVYIGKDLEGLEANLNNLLSSLDLDNIVTQHDMDCNVMSFAQKMQDILNRIFENKTTIQASY